MSCGKQGYVSCDFDCDFDLCLSCSTCPQGHLLKTSIGTG